MLRQALSSLARTLSLTARKSRMFRTHMSRMGFNPSFMSADYRDFAEEGYQQNPYVYAAITQAANSCASVPPQVFRINESSEQVERALSGYERKAHAPRIDRHKKRWAVNRILDREAKNLKAQLRLPYGLCKSMAQKALVREGTLEELDGHESLALLDHPNNYYQRSFQAFMQATVSHLEIGGETFIEPVKGTSGMPRRLFALSPNGVELQEATRENPLPGFDFERGGGTVSYRYDPDPTETEIYFSKYYNPLAPLRGMSPLMAAAHSTDVNNAARTWNLGQLQNGAMMSGFLMSNGRLQDEQRDELKAQFREQHQGPKNAGGIFLVEGSSNGVAFKEAQQTARDMQWGDMTVMTAREISIVYNTPPEILGDSANKTHANYQEARRAYYLEKIIPLLDFIYGEWNSSFMTLYDEPLLLSYDVQRIDALQEDINALFERVVDAIQGSVMRINEGREMINLEPVDGGDAILVPATQMPLNAVLMEGEVDDEEMAAMIDAYQKRGGDGHQSNLDELFPVLSQ